MEPKNTAYSIQRHADAIRCPHCGKSGQIVWDEVSRLNNTASDLVGIDGPFFERLGKKEPYPIELVCRACGNIAATAFPSTSLRERRMYN